MSTPFTLNGWKTTAATLLVSKLPLQTLDESLLLVNSYISTVGGWIPNNPNDPTGEGFPANGLSPANGVDAIVLDRQERIQRLRATLTVEINLDFIANFSPSQTDAEITAQMQPLIEDFVRKQLDDSPLAFASLDSVTGTLTRGGVQTPAQRVALNTAVTAGQTRRDPRVVALTAARRIYSLDTTWNVVSVYTEPDKSIVVIIQKYQTTAYQTLDTSVTNQYVISVSPDSYAITGGIKGPIVN